MSNFINFNYKIDRGFDNDAIIRTYFTNSKSNYFDLKNSYNIMYDDNNKQIGYIICNSNITKLNYVYYITINATIFFDDNSTISYTYSWERKDAALDPTILQESISTTILNGTKKYFNKKGIIHIKVNSDDTRNVYILFDN